MAEMIFAVPDSLPISNNPDSKKIAHTPSPTWKVIISDDDESVHEITKLALRDFQFSGVKLEFVSAYTADETIKAITQHPETAILLQDVVMESDDAGLKVIKHIREKLKNNFVRIILRTGQPGQAPERDIIVNYDINDYKEKTELTSQKLFTLIYSSLRSYRDIMALEHNKTGLKKIIDATAQIFSRQSAEEFISATLNQIANFLYKDDAFICDISTMAVQKNNNQVEIISAIGEYEEYIGKDVKDVLDDDTLNKFNTALEGHKNLYQDGCCVTYFANQYGDELLLCFKGHFNLSELDQNLVDIYIKQVSIIYENMILYHKIEAGQQEIINLLGTSIETRSKETGNHVKRVAAASCLLAGMIGLKKEDIEIVKMASPLHDLGKIGISDAILNKPGKLDSNEWKIMKTHSQIGYDMLEGSDSEVLQAGAIISHEHHEKWDGTGYPQGKKGEDIHIYGRITAIADVFDALANDRCYKKAWPIKDIIELFKQQRGLHFEPRLVDVLLDNIDQFTDIIKLYKD
jgi:response regulator RpfG family c-di-GMP phosphodiesterase